MGALTLFTPLDTTADLQTGYTVRFDNGETAVIHNIMQSLEAFPEGYTTAIQFLDKGKGKVQGVVMYTAKGHKATSEALQDLSIIGYMKTYPVMPYTPEQKTRIKRAITQYGTACVKDLQQDITWQGKQTSRKRLEALIYTQTYGDSV